MAGTRIYYNTISPDPVEQILIDNDVLAVQFFINAVNTKTTGMDLVADYGGIALGEGKFGMNLAMNFNTTVIDGKVANPSVLENNGYDILTIEKKCVLLILDQNLK